MSLISRRWRNVTLWIGFGALVSPLGFNCHSRTDQSAAISKSETQAGGFERPDDADQVVRALASVQPDGAPAVEAKVRLFNSAGAAASALGSSKSDPVVSKGTSLLALYDNECREKNGSLQQNDAGLKYEAVPFQPSEDISLSAMSAQAEADPCLVRIDENRVRQLVAPISDQDRQSFSTQADFQTQATANDPRLNEARHIISAKALQAWDWFYSGSGVKSDVVVAIIDTGILSSHPDLVDNLYVNAGGKNGYDFINNDDNPNDDFGHGTHVAGIVGARANNGIGVTGVMGTRVKLMGVKVLDNQGAGSEAAIVNGIRYAADQGAHVINLSLGGRFTSPTIRDALIYAAGKGVVVIIAAGNDNALMDAGTNFYAPSGYAKDIPGALAVGSVDSATGARSSFSNYSTTYVWIAAPGSNGILSTYTANSYSALQGTSMAAPVVAGTAALIVGSFRAHSIAYTPQEVTSLLTESARPVAALNTTIRSGASLDIERAAKLFFSRYIIAGNGGTDAP